MSHDHANAADAYKFCPRCGSSLGLRALKASEPSRLVCDGQGCGFVFFLDPKVAACTISMHEGGIVLLKRSIEPQLGKWVFPGGFVDRGEPVHQAAVRETLEEVGLKVSLISILDVYSYTGQEVVVVVYAADVVGGMLVAGDESEEVGIFPPEQIPWEELAFPSTKAALRDYLRRFFPRAPLPRL